MRGCGCYSRIDRSISKQLDLGKQEFRGRQGSSEGLRVSSRRAHCWIMVVLGLELAEGKGEELFGEEVAARSGRHHRLLLGVSVLRQLAARGRRIRMLLGRVTEWR